MKITVDEIPLKHFLSLFDPQEPIQVDELGDIMHSSSGFVDERLLGHVKQVHHIIDNDYDFTGLVYFKATIGDIQVQYHNLVYTLSGEQKAIKKLVSKIRMMNSQPDCVHTFNIKYIKE